MLVATQSLDIVSALRASVNFSVLGSVLLRSDNNIFNRGACMDIHTSGNIEFRSRENATGYFLANGD